MNTRPHRLLAVFALALALLPATAQEFEAPPPDAIVPPPESFTVCDPDARPQICTRQYDPVCGAVDTGLRCVTTPCDNTEWRTFANGCSACAEGGVTGWRRGACTRE